MATRLVKSAKKRASRRGATHNKEAAPLTEIVINGDIHIPTQVNDLDSFRNWILSARRPQQGRFAWLNGKLWVEVYSELVNHLSVTELEKMRTKACGPDRQPRTEAKNGRHNRSGARDILIDEIVRIPRWVRDVDSYREWAFSADFPEHGRISFLNGKLWVDLCMETDIHSQIKTVITIVVGSIVLNEVLGRFYADKMLLTSRAVGLSQEPDAMFVSNARFAKGLAVLEKGDQSMEVSLSADMVLEVISKSSVKKDAVDANIVYAKAGIAEYWLVDSTIESPELVIMRLVGGKYVAARRHDGWMKSNVFGRSFRLTCKKDASGMSQFNLETK